VLETKVRNRLVGDLQVELLEDFFQGFVVQARANVHLKALYGRSSHHKIEAIFKAWARAMRVACSHDRRLSKELPSTKALL
jgi:imidazoleglycerol-phosphate dehydratase